MNDKTKNFSFDTKEKDIFSNSQPKQKRNIGGRPAKKEEEKLTIQKTVKFTKTEDEILMSEFEKVKTQFSSFASYLKFLIMEGIKTK